MHDHEPNPILTRFNAVPWHDAALTALSISYTSEEEGAENQVRLSVGLDEGARPVEVIFRDCAYIEADVYLACKTMCSDAIDDAVCYESSEWKDEVTAPGPYDPIQGGRGLDEYLHFSIYLCPPSGTIQILARDFSLEEMPST